MKRYFILVAAVALATVSCSKTYEANPTAPQGIGFGSWAENLSRARTQGSNTFTNGDDFNVYGYKADTTTAVKTTVFNGDVVSYDGTNWTYSPTRYWDQSTNKYTFFAVSPAGKIASADAQTGAFTSNSISFAGNDNDVLVADKKEVKKEAYAQTVTIPFNHITSLVDFKVKKHADLGTDVLAITSFNISNIDNVGTFSINDAYTDKHPVATWNATAHAGSYDNTSGVTSVATLPANVSNSTPDFLIDSLIVMPQTFRTDANIQTVNIEYTITGNAGSGDVATFTKSFNLKLFDNVDDTDNEDTIIGRWEQGKHYTFIITINANKIVFSASITDWVTVDNGYNYLLN